MSVESYPDSLDFAENPDIPSRPNCSHAPPFFSTPASKKYNCVECLIRDRIQAVRDVQTTIRKAGGIYAAAARGEKDGKRSVAAQLRTDMHRRWVKTKLQLLRDLTDVRCLAGMEGGAVDVVEKCGRALRVFEGVERELGVVPGVEMSGEVEEKEDGLEKKGEMELDELKEGHLNCHPPKKIRFVDTAKVFPAGVSSADVEPNEDANIASVPKKEDADETKKGAHFTDIIDTINVDTILPALDAIMLNSGDTDTDTLSTTSTLSATPSEEMPHSRQSDAQKRRWYHNVCHFQRLKGGKIASHYRPGRWSSPNGYEKVNTSMMGMSWAQIEEMNWQDGDAGNDEDWSETAENGEEDGEKYCATVRKGWKVLKALSRGRQAVFGTGIN